MKSTQSLILAAIVGVHALACLAANAEVISYTMGINVNCPSGLSE
jgi:hypothetical protein